MSSNEFAILTLGMGEYFTQRYYHTSFLLYIGGKVVGIDCPEPYRRILAEATPAGADALIDYGDIDELILTHLHGDHCNGLEELLLYRRFILQKKTRIYTTPEVERDVWKHKLFASLGRSLEEGSVPGSPDEIQSGAGYYYDAIEWPFGTSQELHGARIETRRTQHPLPTFGFRCFYKDWSFGYSCDTSFDREYIDWLAETDFVIHECNKGIHTHYEDLEKLPADLRAKMRLVHIPDDFDVENSAIQVMKQGELIDLTKFK